MLGSTGVYECPVAREESFVVLRRFEQAHHFGLCHNTPIKDLVEDRRVRIKREGVIHDCTG
ncbi:MAG: hypothetical protein HPY52_08865 [Firmicutes bacterium]|nr:hypothetical protein [Bacillota bacterium]